MAVHVLIVGGGDGGTILANSLDPRRFKIKKKKRSKKV